MLCVASVFAEIVRLARNTMLFSFKRLPFPSVEPRHRSSTHSWHSISHNGQHPTHSLLGTRRGDSQNTDGRARVT